MAESPLRQPPRIADSTAVRRAPPAARFILRGAEAALAAAGTAFGVQPARLACRAATAGARAALWLGPDEQLLLAPGADAATVGRELEAALVAHAHALVEVSHRQVGIVVSGQHAPQLLNGACPLDLSERVFATGMCTRTIFGKAEVVLWRTSAESFHLEVWRSFASYVSELLAEIGRELSA